MKGTRSFLLFFLPFVIFAYISFVAFQQACYYAMNVQAEKLLPFNHSTHVNQYGASDCTMCHSFESGGRFRGIPTVSACLQCHDLKKASNKALFEGFSENDKPWETFALQPDLVYFSHLAHIAEGDDKHKVSCISCHGDKANSTTTEKIKGRMAMGVCMDCHDKTKAINTCAVCHD